MPVTLTLADMAAIERALSTPRFGRYLAEKGGNHAGALALYDWNARVSAALMHPLHIFEVALRNGVAAAVEAEYGPGWHLDPFFIGSLPQPKGPHYKPREDLRAATDRVKRELLRLLPAHSTKPVRVPAGKVMAELKFMFWVSLLTARHDGKIWGAHLRAGFPGAPAAGPGGVLPRRRLHDEAEAVRDIRNRIAHHEPIFMRDLGAEYARILRVVRWRCRRTALWLHGSQSVAALLQQRP